MNKTKNLTSLILQLFSFSLLFVPGTYSLRYWIITSYFGDGYSKSSENVSVMFKFFYFDEGKILGALLLLSMLTTLIILIIQLNTEKQMPILCFTTIVQALLFVIYSFAFTEESVAAGQNYFEYRVEILFYFILAVFVANVLIPLIFDYINKNKSSNDTVHYNESI